MSHSLSLGLAQINPTVGDVAGNITRIRDARKANGKADLVITGEMVVSGYPPEDLVLKSAFQDAVEAAVQTLAGETADGGAAILLGAPWRDGDRLHNAALLLEDGHIAAVRFKYDLPNYGVFDEKRLFSPSFTPDPIPFRGVKLGVMICEDMWTEEVAEHLKEKGAEVLISLNASPYEVDKAHDRGRHGVARVSETGLPLIYVNITGGQDELVFDGGSFVLDAAGETVLRTPGWEAGDFPLSLSKKGEAWVPEKGLLVEPSDEKEAIWKTLVLGLRDYVNKNYFSGVLIGLSGGIDSALSAAIAVDALGAERVHCVMMPSPYTSKESLEDAEGVARRLGVKLDTIPITDAMNVFDEMLKETFVQHPADTTEENIQARVRGLILMAISNKLGFMVLSTGNKSEMSVGYATLYGDMCGGYSVLKDVYKTTVFALSHWRNENRPDGMAGPKDKVMPDRVITKPPSAELKPHQKDEDSLPPYEELDDILRHLIEYDLSLEKVTARGHDAELVKKIWTMLDRAEYKRRQAPPGVKISSRSFGRDRRYPITNAFTVSS